MTNGDVIRVRDVMSTRYVMIDGLMTVKEALELLRDGEPCPFIVEKRWATDEYGMLLLGDVAKKVLAVDRAPERVNVYEVMSKPLIHVSPEMDIRYCARLMDRFDISHVPVIENGDMIGIVSFPAVVLRGLLPRM